MMYEPTPVAELNNTMAKERVVPRYELMFQDTRYGRETFMMRVTCPLRFSGNPVTAYGRYCATERAAKHSAALAFMDKFFRRENAVEYSPPRVYRSREDEEDIYNDKLEELETFCYDNYLDYPTFCDVSAEGPQHYLTWTIECYASDYVTEGKGRRKIQARTQAIRKMIKLLTGGTAHDHEIISLSDDPEGYQPADQNCSFDGGKSNSVHAGNKSVDNCGGHATAPIEHLQTGAAEEFSPITSRRGNLETFCSENNLEQPTYWTIGAEGPEHSLTWTIECRVADFVTRGAGKRKSEAAVEAARRMMERLTKESETYDNEIVSSRGDPKGYQPKEKSGSKSTDRIRSASIQQEAGGLPLAEAPGACRSPNTAESLLKSLKDQKRDSEAREDHYDPGTDLKPKDLNKDSQQEIVSMKSNSPHPDTDARDCIDGGVESSSSPDPPRQLTRLQAVSGINRILRTSERALHDNILSALIHTDLPYRATVRILCQEYVVFIKQDLPPMIFEEHYECSDQSIRVACLTRLLLDLTDRLMKG